MALFYKGYGNVACFQLKKKNCETGQIDIIDLSTVTKMEMFFMGALYSSENEPQAFDWSVNPPNGVFHLIAGLIPTITIGRDSKTEIMVYDPSNPAGLVFKPVYVKMDEVA